MGAREAAQKLEEQQHNVDIKEQEVEDAHKKVENAVKEGVDPAKLQALKDEEKRRNDELLAEIEKLNAIKKTYFSKDNFVAKTHGAASEALKKHNPEMWKEAAPS